MKFILTTIAVFITILSVAQSTDTLIYAQGKIISAATKEPITAKISYQSEPYANVVGSLSGSSFLFPLFEGEKYSIIIEAPGFAPAKYLLDPAEANAERKVVRDVELSLPTTVAKNSETTSHRAGHIMRLDNLIFAVGTARISPESHDELDEVVVMLKNNPAMVVQLEGHTDIKGDPKLNMKLSQERVDAVKNYLVSKVSNRSKIKTKAFGGTSPLSRENTEEAHKMNRRVELRILQN
ncbi:MAG: OmpA family protein [Cyclobacteriaceae bacterium]|nr:OmpA family protein [Cyclobacteriaceae bacterium]